MLTAHTTNLFIIYRYVNLLGAYHINIVLMRIGYCSPTTVSLITPASATTTKTKNKILMNYGEI